MRLGTSQMLLASCLEQLNGPAALVPAKDTGRTAGDNTAANKGTSLSDEKVGMTVI